MRPNPLSFAVEYRENGKPQRLRSLFEDLIDSPSRRLLKPWHFAPEGKNGSRGAAGRDGAGAMVFGPKSGGLILGFRGHVSRLPHGSAAGSAAYASMRESLESLLAFAPGARPVLSASLLFLPPPDAAAGKARPAQGRHEELSSPKRLALDVIEGVSRSANASSVPAASGALWFDAGHAASPVSVSLGFALAPARAAGLRPEAGHKILMAGRMGAPLADLWRTLEAAGKKGLFSGGACVGPGGVGAALGDLVGGLGACVEFSAEARALCGAPDSSSGEELWGARGCAMCLLAAPAAKASALASFLKSAAFEACLLGEIRSGQGIELSLNKKRAQAPGLAQGAKVGSAAAPRKAQWSLPRPSKAKAPAKTLPEILRLMVGNLNLASRESLIRARDFEAQGLAAIKPLQGVCHDGPGDACAIWPLGVTGDFEDFNAFAVGHGLAQEALPIDPAWAAVSAADEALRNVLCAGADAGKAAFLASLFWPDASEGAALGGLVRALKGLKDAIEGYGIPVLNVSAALDDKPGTRGPEGCCPVLSVSAVAPLKDVRRALTLDLKAPGNALWLVGATGEDFGGSLYSRLSGAPGGVLPRFSPRQAMAGYRAVARAAEAGLLASAHDLSEGGLGVAAAEMGFAGEFGVLLDLDRLVRGPRSAEDMPLLFSETPGRILLEVKSGSEKEVEKIFKGLPARLMGETIANPVLKVKGLDGTVVLEESLLELKAVWQKALPEAMAV